MTARGIPFEKVEGFWSGTPDGGVLFHEISQADVQRVVNPVYEPTHDNLNDGMTPDQRADFTAFMQDSTAELDRNFGTVIFPDQPFPVVSDEQREYDAFRGPLGD